MTKELNEMITQVTNRIGYFPLDRELNWKQETIDRDDEINDAIRDLSLTLVYMNLQYDSDGDLVIKKEMINETN